MLRRVFTTFLLLYKTLLTPYYRIHRLLVPYFGSGSLEKDSPV